MARICDSLEIELKTTITVTEKTASACLRLVNIFLEEHPDKEIGLVGNEGYDPKYEIIDKVDWDENEFRRITYSKPMEEE